MANVNVTDFDPKRQRNYAASTSGYPLAGAYAQPASQAHAIRTAQYLSTTNSMIQHTHGNSGMDALVQSFCGMSLQPPYASAGKPGSQMSATTEYSAMPLSQAPALYIPNTQQLLYPGGHLMSGVNTAQAANLMYTPISQYVQRNNYPGYGQRNNDNNPNAQMWTSHIPSDGSQGMPTLIIPRQNSVSSNEEHLPRTPFTGVSGYGSYGSAIAVLDRSSSGHFTQMVTPSSSPFLPPYVFQNLGKFPTANSTPLELQLLVQREPAIPRAIPAPSSPIKSLDRCLENKNGETNVYIRGLVPETTDEMLKSWGDRFGGIVSSKAIIDHKTNLCKGFGFIKYHNFGDAENCIRGFHYLGYETSYARESFNVKLKKLSDEANTNLYVSNIPKNMNEHELSACFQPFKVCSAKILRDDAGNGRGVGFARFETRDTCEEIIKKFNNTSVSRDGEEEHIILIRYADTHEQKMLKQQTVAARQFRAAEFEYGCLQVGHGVLLHAAGRVHSVSPAGTEHARTTNDFERYMQHGNAVYLPRPPRARIAFLTGRPSLPTIKSYPDGTAPQANLPSQSKEDGGVPLPSEASQRLTTPSAAHDETSAIVAAAEDQN